MHSAIESMLEKYNCRDLDDYKNALKEIIQETALLGLYRGGFFKYAAFYGETALRIFYNLDRFSEDLDFSLLTPEPNFDLSVYEKFIRDELGSFGFTMSVETKQKSNKSNIQSAFIKGGTQIHLLKIDSITPPVQGIHKDEKLKIKIEVDIDPPAGAEFEVKYHLNPLPFSVQLFKPSSLFAGKVHAILFRSWNSRVKGRDFYDYVWFLKKNIPINIDHLERRARQSGNWLNDHPLDFSTLKKLLFTKFEKMDFIQAQNDVIPFISDPVSVDLWSAYFFKKITDDFLITE